MGQSSLFERGINYMLALFLALMGTFVFINVLMRYFFNSGLTWAEEFSRILFVWLIFIGSLGALKDNNHLGFSSFVQRLPAPAKKACFLFFNVLTLVCLGVLFIGSIRMTEMTTRAYSPSTGIPLAYLYGSGIVLSTGMFVIICHKLYQAIFVKGAIDNLVVLKESEDEVRQEQSQSDKKNGGEKP